MDLELKRRLVEAYNVLARGCFDYPAEQQPACNPAPTPAPAKPSAAATPEFTHFTWPSPGMRERKFTVNRAERAVLQVMAEAMLEGSPCVREDYLLGVARRAGLKVARLRDVFKTSGAWGVLVVQGPDGTYSLPPIPDEDEEAA